MKFKTICIAILLLISILLVGCSEQDEENEVYQNGYEQVDGEHRATIGNLPQGGGDEYPGQDYEYYAISEFRAVWVTSVFNLDFPTRQGMSVAALKLEIDNIVERAAEIGLNAIIFQVRPTGDALYESDIFPWSHWLSGTQGEGIPDIYGDGYFDLLEYFIEVAHAHNIELHAWINPYRIIHTATNTSDPNTLAPNNPVRLRPELAVAWSTSGGNQGLFLDPGLPEARQLILDGIEEIIRRYNVDGIHFDDYFYPGSDFDDVASFERYGNGMELGDWRRENVNTLIRDIQSTIRDLNYELDRNVVWGISPTAIWKNCSSDPLGVPGTRGQESYFALYADTRLWVTEGLVDHIIPQIYWYKGFEIADFNSVFDWWVDLCREYDMELFIGLAAWREVEGHQAPNWDGEIIRQLETIASSDHAAGSVFFRMYNLNGWLGNEIRDFYNVMDGTPPREPVMILDTLGIGAPAQDVTINASADNARGFNIVGTSVPGVNLYLNGEIVTNRTVEGFFFVHVPLESGENVFTFSQEGQEDVTRIIRRDPPTGGPTPATTPTITQIETIRYATVNDFAWAYPGSTATGGTDLMLVSGQQDRVTAESSNGFVRLSSGVWVRQNAVTIGAEDNEIENPLQNGIYRIGHSYDALVWQSDVFAVIDTRFNGETLRLNFGMHTELPPLNLPVDLTHTLFTDVVSGINDEIPFYEFTIRSDFQFEGYYFTFEDGELSLKLRIRRSLSPGERPLENIVIILDPGHGGTDYGAVGPMGRVMTEKYLVLLQAQMIYERLTELGATVHLTRNEDVYVSLQDRVNMSREIMPDMFISLHINSVAETTNAENIRGFSIFYRNSGSVPLAQTMLDILYNVIPNSNRYRGINQTNFFVNRPSWTPSVLLEAGFIVNIDDFVWMIDPEMQEKYADAVVVAILDYFS